MHIGGINISDQVLIIAEIGNNHEGDFELAKRMVNEAAQSGVDVVKFQTIVPEKLMVSSEVDRIAQLNKFRFSQDQFKELATVAADNGVLFMSTPFDLDSVDYLNEIVPAFKIASSDNNFYPLLKKVIETGKPVIVSTGLLGKSEMETTLAFFREHMPESEIYDRLALLHCVSSYPTQAEDANLLNIAYLKNQYSGVVGYSDHTLGIEAATLSIGMGARIVEKHFTIDKNYSDFRDHLMSADPQEMSELVIKIRNAEVLLGNFDKSVADAELGVMKAGRRSLAVNKSLEPGTEIRMEDITWLRPGDGIQVGDENQVIGKRLKKAYASGQMLSIDDLE